MVEYTYLSDRAEAMAPARIYGTSPSYPSRKEERRSHTSSSAIVGIDRYIDGTVGVKLANSRSDMVVFGIVYPRVIRVTGTRVALAPFI